MIAAFNVNKSAQNIAGRISAADVESIFKPEINRSATIAVYQRSSNQILLLDEEHRTLPFSLGSFGYDLFTLAPVSQGLGVFGLLDKYLGPAAVVSQKIEKSQVVIRLREAGDFGAWLERPPARVELDGQTLPQSSYSYDRGLLRVPQSSFGNRTGERELRLLLASPKR
jgi:hypothetical protein